ncbi:MAG: hypothetical protein MUC32_09885 [Burkholderiaceae bacterium]|nr:hypothetical protein [Burkholderiaceae bacterium]
MSEKTPAGGNGERSHRMQVVVAVIGVVGTLGTALIANWDKVFGPSGGGAPKPPAVTPGTQGAGSPILSNVTGDVKIQIGSVGSVGSLAAVADVAGRWVSDELTNPYDASWRYVLHFDLRVQGDVVVGSVTQRFTQPREQELSLPVVSGRVDGPTVSFQTRSEVLSGLETRQMTTYYVGTLRDGVLQLTRQNDSPGGGVIEAFAARRP